MGCLTSRRYVLQFPEAAVDFSDEGAGEGEGGAAREPRLSSSAGTPPGQLEACSVPARDLVARLLERDPRKRLRSLHALQTIAFYMNFSFTDVRAKRVSLMIIFFASYCESK